MKTLAIVSPLAFLVFAACQSAAPAASLPRVSEVVTALEIGDEPVALASSPATSANPGTPSEESRAVGTTVSHIPASDFGSGQGQVASLFELPNATGGTISLEDYRGDSNVVVVFYRGFW